MATSSREQAYGDVITGECLNFYIAKKLSVVPKVNVTLTLPENRVPRVGLEPTLKGF